MQKLLTFFSRKNIGIFEILTFEILTKRYLTMSLVLNNRALNGCGEIFDEKYGITEGRNNRQM